MTFPCKSRCEEVNTTLEGLTDKERHQKAPEIVDAPRDDDDDDGGDDDGGGDEGPHGGDPGIKEVKDKSLPMGDVEPRMGEETMKVTKHYSEGGKPGDGIIYLNDEWVKLGKSGVPYRVGEDGRRYFYGSPRPRSEHLPEEWQRLSVKKRELLKKKKEIEEEAAREMWRITKSVAEPSSSSTKKPSGHSKAKPKPVKTLKEKKKEKKSKKKEGVDDDKGGGDEDDHKDVSVAESKDLKFAYMRDEDGGKDKDDSSKYVRIDAVYPNPDGVGVTHPSSVVVEKPFYLRPSSYVPMPHQHEMSHHSEDYGLSSPISSSMSTGSPSDDEEEFDYEWDSWAAIENGHGPSATWDADNLYDEERGMVSAASHMIIEEHADDLTKHKPRCFPTMPCVYHAGQHREKLSSNYVRATNLGFNAFS